MDDKFLIHVEIAGKSYGIRINRSEEQVAREAVRQIRKKMDQYRKKYSDVDVKDLLAMVAFQLSMSTAESALSFTPPKPPPSRPLNAGTLAPSPEA